MNSNDKEKRRIFDLINKIKAIQLEIDIPEFKCPLWYESDQGAIVEFSSLRSGVVVSSKEGLYMAVGNHYDNLPPHTNEDIWTEVSDPALEGIN